MKTCFLFLIGLFFTAGVARSQGLTADAGPNKAWCSSPSAVAPTLGSPTPATGGTAPYAFEWSLWYQPYSGSGITPDPTFYLNNYQSAQPNLIQKPYSTDSMRAVLKVTDASGNVAYDSTWVYFQNAIYLPAMAVFFKGVNDTIQIDASMGGAASRFYPYSEYRWRPADYLVDSTVKVARCYSPVTKVYDFYQKDRIGCPLSSRTEVIVYPQSVSQVPEQTLSLHLDAPARTLSIRGLSAGRVQFTDLNGRKVWEEIFSGNTALQVPVSLPSGIYIAQLTDAKGQPLLRQQLALP